MLIQIMEAPHSNPKNQLQEHLQKLGQPPPVYETMKVIGTPSHAPTFQATLYLFSGGEPLSEATGNSVKEAEKNAASKALEKLKRPKAEMFTVQKKSDVFSLDNLISNKRVFDLPENFIILMDIEHLNCKQMDSRFLFRGKGECIGICTKISSASLQPFPGKKITLDSSAKDLADVGLVLEATMFLCRRALSSDNLKSYLLFVTRDHFALAFRELVNVSYKNEKLYQNAHVRCLNGLDDLELCLNELLKVNK